MSNISQIKKKFYRDGFVKVQNLFTKHEIKRILIEIEKLKNNFKKIKNRTCIKQKIKNLIQFMISINL